MNPQHAINEINNWEHLLMTIAVMIGSQPVRSRIWLAGCLEVINTQRGIRQMKNRSTRYNTKGCESAETKESHWELEVKGTPKSFISRLIDAFHHYADTRHPATKRGNYTNPTIVIYLWLRRPTDRRKPTRPEWLNPQSWQPWVWQCCLGLFSSTWSQESPPPWECLEWSNAV